MQSLIHGNFEGAAQKKTYALVGAAAAIAAAVGPLLGGFVTTYLSWRVGFLLEVVVIAVVLSQIGLRQGRPVHGSAAGRRGRRGPVRRRDGRRRAGHPGVAGGRRLRRAADRDRRARALGARPLARAAPSRGQGDAARSGPVPAPALQGRDHRADAAEHHARRGDDRAADLPADQARVRRPADGPVARPALADHVRRRDPRRTEVRRPAPGQHHPDRVRADARWAWR